jgi:hypothetical protein
MGGQQLASCRLSPMTFVSCTMREGWLSLGRTLSFFSCCPTTTLAPLVELSCGDGDHRGHVIRTERESLLLRASRSWGQCREHLRSVGIQSILGVITLNIRLTSSSTPVIHSVNSSNLVSLGSAYHKIFK